MRAAVFSDTHANIALAAEAIRRTRPDVIIHLGDNVRDALAIGEEFPGTPLYYVRGNCDLGDSAPNTDIVPLGPVKAFITHGHIYGVKFGQYDRLAYAAVEAGAKIAMFGHTHSATVENYGGVTVLNPGAAGRGRAPSYALVEVNDIGGFSCEIRPL